MSASRPAADVHDVCDLSRLRVADIGVSAGGRTSDIGVSAGGRTSLVPFDLETKELIRDGKDGIGLVHTRNTRDISSRTRLASRTMDDFRNVQEITMGRAHFELSRSAEASLRTAMASAIPLVIRSALTSRDMMELIDEWELFMAQDKTLYQMGGGKGRQTLATMWGSPMRLEHDLRDTSTPNPVMTWLSAAPRGSVVARVWQLQQQLEGVAASHGPILRRPAFATGLIPVGGGPAHFDEYSNTALVIAGRKTFFICPPRAMAWQDGQLNGKYNERLDVNPFVPGPHPEPTLGQWRLADLHPGDVLYLPAGWWHYVVSEPHSIMTNVWTD